MLEQLTCEQSPGGLHRLLRVAPGQQPLLQAYRVLACNGSRAARRDRFAQLAAELRNQLDTRKIVSRVRAGLWDVPPSSCGVGCGAGTSPGQGFLIHWGMCGDGGLCGMAQPLLITPLLHMGTPSPAPWWDPR